MMQRTQSQFQICHPVQALSTTRTGRLSYKFQRLRERIRQAIVSGELTGKLPGERELARRFHANAKTLSKALTDLAAEGLLDRSIGRGTFVRGASPVTARQERWMLLCDASQVEAPLLRRLKLARPDAHVVATDASGLRPSFVSQFGAVIDLSPRAPEAFLRDLLVRGMPIVTVGRDPRAFSTHVVMLDRVLALSCIARDLVLAGHRHVAAVEPQGSTLICQTLRDAARRYVGGAEVDSCFADDAVAMVEHGATAIVCDSVESAGQVRQALEQAGLAVPQEVSLMAIGSLDLAAGERPPCSGYFIDVDVKVRSILQVLQDKPPRPVGLWLKGQYMEEQTLGTGDVRPEMSLPLPMLVSA